MSKEAMKLALEALEYYQAAGLATTRVAKSITALREALAEQPAQQEPVFTYDQVKAHIQAAMMSAAQRTWVGLNDDELADFWFKQSLDWMEFARVIEDALRSKNT